MIITLVVVLVAIGAAYWFMTLGPGIRITSPEGSTVAEFSGSGDQITGTFDVRDQWQIHWESSGGGFAFAITGDRDLGTIISEEEPGSGVTSVVPAGTFKLEISADGSWQVRIVQGE